MYASIDVGSNTVRMMIGNRERGRLVPHLYRRCITRLGGGLSSTEGLSEESMNRTLDALEGFALTIRESPVRAVRMVGTEALRRAINRTDFVERVARRTDLTLEIIPGPVEAELSAAGVLEALEPRPDVCLIIDIGGGSTELILVKQGAVQFRESYPLGVVRLCEEQPDAAGRTAAIGSVIGDFVQRLDCQGLKSLLMSGDCELVGTAGTVTTLAALDQQMVDYDWRRINNYRLSAATLHSQYRTLTPLSVAEREGLSGLEEGRGDLIMPGLEILLELTTISAHDAVRVSDFGLLEGVLLALVSSDSVAGTD
ncbi:MAG: exopolyphosphatase [Desulfuromonas sp.]|nr:MAG: exopolyphosphatase [Desulfuromonas sp.]